MVKGDVVPEGLVVDVDSVDVDSVVVFTDTQNEAMDIARKDDRLNKARTDTQGIK